MKIHLIAVGGAAMHNLALALKNNGHVVSGSDDEIYNPAYERLKNAGILPVEMGWFPEKISTELDIIILGMHARKDNPELLKAQDLGLKIYSYPEYIYEHAKNKKRIVIAGSHGKTTTTSMIMHVLKYWKCDFDYLVGAMVEGFETMVRLSDAPIMVIEGDEYLSSPIDLVPKIHHYKPHIAVITGIAWDHINVFPTFESYVNQFKIFIKTILTEGVNEGVLFYDKSDNELVKIAQNEAIKIVPYQAFDSINKDGETIIKPDDYDKEVALKIFGEHNLKNLKAAYLVCQEIDIKDEQFFEAIQSFEGAAKRLQILYKSPENMAFLDFAHAPSKVKATVSAVKAQFSHRPLAACLELHTFSSLNKAFLPQYAHAMDSAEFPVVYFNEHTLTMKKMPPLSISEIKAHFAHPNLQVFTDNKTLLEFLNDIKKPDINLLFMTSGTFNGLDLKKITQDYFSKPNS